MQIEKKTLRNIFIGVISCIVLYWLLHETERVKSVLKVIGNVLSPFALGAAIAFVVNVPMRGIEGLLTKIKNTALKRVLALLITFVCILLVLTVVFLLLIPQLSETIQSLLPKLYNFIINIGTHLKDKIQSNPELMAWIANNTELENLNWADLAQKAITFVSNSVSTIVSGAFAAIGSITGAMVDAVIAIVFSIYCLFQKETLARQGRRILYSFLPEKFVDNTIRILRLTNSTFSNFLSGQCIEVVILGCLFAVSMAIFGMPYIPLVSVLVAVTAFIPVVGAWVGCVLGAFFILVANPMQAVWFVVMFLILQQIENNLIYPRVVGTSIGLSGMWVLVAVGVGGELMGVAGMLLMIPVTSVIQTVLSEVVSKKLSQKEISAEKLVAQPPELQRRIRRKIKKVEENKES